MNHLNSRPVFHTLLITSLFGLMTSGIAVTAAAGTADLPTAIAHYADLNLASASGAEQLYRRITIAARNVCPTADGRDLQATARMKACVSQAISGAVAKVDAPMLNTLYAAKTGISPPARLASVQVR